MASQFRRTPLYTVTEELSPLDHQVLLNGGTSSRIERLPSRNRQSKLRQRSSSYYQEDQIVELAYETSYLRAQLAFNEESRQALLELRNKMTVILGMIDTALAEVSERLREADQNYLKLFGIDAPKRESGVEI